MGEGIWRVRGGYVGGTFGKVGSGGHAVVGVHGGGDCVGGRYVGGPFFEIFS